ncbi:phospholipase D-like domain-containing protein [Streptomyces sp. NPDC012438]|uniref:phospholipase D-like domain-containing protein n=1 Tax=Streptomyces sp. NPDC012438 TaxID=3364833 RepID=UPI0036E72E85
MRSPHVRIITGRGGAGVLLVFAVLVALLVPARNAEAATVTTGPIFNRPTGDTAEQQAIRSQVRSVIANADSGSIIRLAMYHLWDDTIAADLVSAKNRGVNVRIVLDRTTLDHPSSYDTLRAALGTSASATS